MSVLDSASLAMPDNVTVVSPTEARQASRHAAALALGQRASTRCLDLKTLLEDAAALLVESLGADLASISRVEDGSLNIQIVGIGPGGHNVELAGASQPLAADASIHGYALQSGGVVVCTDRAKERRFTDALLAEHHIKTALAAPMLLNGQPFGTLAALCRKPHDYTTDDARFTETIASLTMAGAARAQIEEELHQRDQTAAAMMDAVADLVMVVDPHGQIREVNLALTTLIGQTDDLAGRLVWDAVFTESGRYEVHNVFLAAEGRLTCPTIFARVQTASKRHVETVWSASPLYGRDGTLTLIVFTGQPVAAKPGQVGTAAQQPFAPTGTPAGREQRRSPRRTFRYEQLIAPLYSGTLPNKARFFPVECRDLSAGGIAFYLPDAPDFNALVVGLGKPPDLTYFTARVVRVSEEETPDGLRWVIGAQFTGRVHI